MSLITILLILSCTIFFGGSFIYFVRVIDANSENKVTSKKLITSFFGDLRNVIVFYKTFIGVHENKNHSFAVVLVVLHILSPVILWILVIYSALKTGDLAFY